MTPYRDLDDQKREEIKRLAREIYVQAASTPRMSPMCPSEAYSRARDFVEYDPENPPPVRRDTSPNIAHLILADPRPLKPPATPMPSEGSATALRNDQSEPLSRFSFVLAAVSIAIIVLVGIALAAFHR